jgi:hypothetical protein
LAPEAGRGAEGFDYIRESLSGGRRLSRAVLDRLDSERGVLTTFVPPMTPTEELTRFHTGGKYVLYFC